MKQNWMQIDKDTFVGDVNGIGISVFRDEDGEWSYLVQPQGSRNEFPEVFAYGKSSTKKIAMQKGWRSAQQADRTYPIMSKEGW